MIIDRIKKIQEFAEMGLKEQEARCQETEPLNCLGCTKCPCYCILAELGLREYN